MDKLQASLQVLQNDYISITTNVVRLIHERALIISKQAIFHVWMVKCLHCLASKLHVWRRVHKTRHNSMTYQYSTDAANNTSLTKTPLTLALH